MLLPHLFYPLIFLELLSAIDHSIGWHDRKWGRERSTQTWVKVHVMIGVKTNLVTAVEATATESADSPQLPQVARQNR